MAKKIRKHISKQELLKYVKFLESAKQYVGLSDYKIKVSTTVVDLGTSYAEASPDIYEKTLQINLTKNFLQENDERKINILLHELVHGRIEIYNMKLDNLKEDLEEDLANDITRGFERLKDLSF